MVVRAVNGDSDCLRDDCVSSRILKEVTLEKLTFLLSPPILRVPLREEVV